MLLENPDDHHDDKSVNHHKKWLNLRLKDGIKRFENEFHLNDYVTEGFVDGKDGASGSGTDRGYGASSTGNGNADNGKDKGKGGNWVQSGSSTSGSGHVSNIVDTDTTLATQGDIVLSGGIAVLYLFMNLLSDLAQYKYLEMQAKAKVSRDAQNMANEVNEIIADVSKQSNPDTARQPLPADVIKYMEDNDVKVDDKTIDQYLDEAAGKGSGQVPEGGAWYQTADGKRKVWVYDDSHGQWFVAGGNQTIDVHNGQKVDKPFVNSDGKVQFDFEINHQTFQTYGIGGDMHGTDPRYIPPGTQFYLVEPTPSDRAHIGLNKGQLDAVKSALENTSNRASDFVSQSQLQLQKIMQTYNVTVSLINSMQTLLEEMNKSIAQNIR